MASLDWRSLSVLIVDDNKYICLLMQTILRSTGIRNINIAHSGSSALTLLKDFCPDIAIVDVIMDGIDGIEFTKTVRSDRNGLDIFLPIILVSASTDMATIRKAISAGANDFVTKPLAPANLLVRVSRALLKPRLFIRSSTFFGPDRRRVKPPPYNGIERRKTSG